MFLKRTESNLSNKFTLSKKLSRGIPEPVSAWSVRKKKEVLYFSPSIREENEVSTSTKHLYKGRDNDLSY